MGDPKFQRKKYVTPGHPWQKERLEAERVLVSEYGIRNKKELWRMDSIRKRFTERVKTLVAGDTPQRRLEMQQLLDKLFRLGLIEDVKVNIDNVLGLELRNVLERRLQTLVFRKNLAHSMSQARQFIVHGHIYVGDKKITSPSHLTTRDEEAAIRYAAESPLADPNHPEIAKEIKKKEGKK